MTLAIPTKSELNRLFRYSNGGLYWRARASSRAAPGAEAGYTRPDGRVKVRVRGTSFYRYRLVWALLRGPVPPGKEVDHQNRNPGDDRIENLRVVSHRQNQRNMSRKTHVRGEACSSVFKGVSWNKATGCWRASISVGGRTKSLGSFSREALAAEAYDRAAWLWFGDHAATNKDMGLLRC